MIRARLVEVRTTRPDSKAALSVMGRTVRGRKKREGRVRGWEAAPGDSGLRRLAEVAVVQAADFRKLYAPARRGELDGSEVGHALHSVPKLLAVDLVTVAQEIGRCGVVREGVHDLLGQPSGAGMLGDIEVEDAAAVVGQYDEDEQHAQAHGEKSEEIDGDEVRT